MTRRVILRAAVAAAVLVFLVAAWIGHFIYAPLGFPGETRDFDIEQGATLRGVTRKLADAGILSDSIRFELLGRALKKGSELKAGIYQIEASWSALQLLQALTGSAQRLDKIVLVEGWTFRQIRQALHAHDALRHDSLAMTDAQILAKLGMQEGHPEGLFFPDTYFFARGTSDLGVLSRSALRMQAMLSRQWEERAHGLVLKDAYEALILASIVEKETGRDSDRAMIAAVFHNRLRKGMRLQTDPTVIYGLGVTFDGDLRRRDLETDGPYNTYVRTGLPPTPIAMPGLASLQAALHPAQTDACYFVARGDGSSEFSATLAEHNRAVSRYQRVQAPRK